MTIQEIKELIGQSRYDEAYEECEKLLVESPAQKNEILRTRAHGYARSADYANSVRDYEEVIASPGAQDSDFYLAAFNALYTEDYLKAEKWFNTVLKNGEENNETWFRSATLFYLSYINMELGNYDKALMFLDKLIEMESDGNLPLPEVGMCSGAKLRTEIESRKKN